METVVALSTFYYGLIADGLDTKMIAWNAFVPDNLIAAITPQMLDVTLTMLDPWTNVGPFVLADLSVNGLKGNASTKYLNTGYQIDSPHGTDFGISLYASAVTATGGDCGGFTTSGVILDAKFSDNNAYSFNGAIAANSITVASPGAGFYSGQRTSSTVHKLYFANSGNAHAQIGATDTTAVGAGAGSVPLIVFGSNHPGFDASLSADTLSFVGFSAGLSSAQSAALFLRVQALRQALGGGYI